MVYRLNKRRRATGIHFRRLLRALLAATVLAALLPLGVVTGLLYAAAPTKAAKAKRPPEPAGPEITDTAARGEVLSRCPPVAFIKRRAEGLRGTNATMHSRMTGVGSAICIYDPARPEAGAKTIFDDPQGFIFDMSPSYDAKKLVFAYKKDVPKREDPLHIYEINVDGTGLRQLTTGRYHDFNAAYLPDGRIVFGSTRVESYSL
ncbi:MAG: hypothetical protein NT049_15715, partial [Planctomycetota bacterium]|nr:hypothetical protein [Planctomycetota bacterium]